MIIERSRYSPNGAVSPGAQEAIREVELRATDEYIAYLQEAGEVAGEKSVTRITSSALLDEDLQPYFGNREVPVFILDKMSDFGPSTLAIDLTTKRGVQRCVEVDEAPEYFETDESYWQYLGFSLLREMFQPGSHPELSELAAIKGATLVNVGEMNARLMTAEEYKRSMAIATLSKLTLSHLGNITDLYNSTAYPGQEQSPYRPEGLDWLLHDLQQGQSIGLRSGTKYLSCAKHEFIGNAREDILKTWMYLNYDIRFGPVQLHFNEDIDMAVEFGEQAASYFDDEGLVVS